MKPIKDVTPLLHDAARGDEAASRELVLEVYQELRELAARYLRHERPDHTLQPTALVHEAFLRLVPQQEKRFENRAHFFRIAAQMMRRVLIDHARRHRAARRGGGWQRTSLTDLATELAQGIDLLALDEALEALEVFDARKCRVVELRYFAGFGTGEIATILGVTARTVERDWAVARAWLFKELGKGDADGSEAMEAD